MERLIIKKLGVLNEIELDLKNFLLFYGISGSGKSTLAKAIYFFKSFRTEFQKFIINALWSKNADLSISAFNRLMRTKFLRLFGPTFGQKNIEITYFLQDKYQISVGLKGKYVDFNFHEDFKHEVFDTIVKKLKSFFKDLSNYRTLENFDIREEKKKFMKIIINEINTLFGDKRYLHYFPANRSVLALFSKFDMQELENNNFLLYELYNYISNVKRRFNKSLQEIELKAKQISDKEIDSELLELARELIKDIIKDKYISDNSGDKLYYNDSNYIRLNFASAAQQSALYLTHLIYLWLLDKTPIFTVIEDPEIALTPLQQRNLIKLIALLNNTADNQIIITTKSPYVIYQISNLLYAYNQSKEHYEEIAKIINPKFWIKTANFKGFEFGENEITPIFENELFLGYEFIETSVEPIDTEYKKIFKLD